MQARAVVSSALLPVEVTSALARRRREGRISAATLSRLLRRVQADRDSWELVPVSDEILDAAGRCLVDHSLRTLDAIHLASAHRLHREGLELPFVTADARQASAARALGLEVADASR